MKTLRLSNEYQCYPTWIDDDGLENVDPRSLMIPKSLAAKIDYWDNLFQQTYHPKDPASSGFDQEEDRNIFLENGIELFKELKVAIAKSYQLEYRAIDGTRHS